MTVFQITRDNTGAVGYGLAFSNNKKKTTLASNVEQTFTVPTFAAQFECVFSFEPGTSVWVGIGSTPVSLPGASWSDANEELNPTVRRVPGGSTLRFITGNTSAEAGVTMYAIG